MKKILNIVFFTALVMLMITSCKKTAELTYLKTISFPPVLTASVNDIVLTTSNDDAAVVQFAWPAVKYDIAAPVTYTLQFTLASDTLGATAWSNAKDSVVGADVLSKSFIGSSLNDLARNGLGLPVGTAATVAVRVKAFLDRPVYSNAVTVTINPHSIFTGYPVLYVPGDYQGWNPAAAAKIASLGSDSRYEGYFNIPAGGTYQFKLTAQPDWTPTAYGDTVGIGNLVVANFSGGNLNVPTDGYYELTADLVTMKWKATKTTWGIIGDATPNGWGGDTQMSFDAGAQVWKVTCNMTAAGSFKFRANGAWAIDFAIDASGKLMYADNPFFPYNGSLNNLSVPSDGNYTITLDLHDPTNYTYILHKN